VRQAIGASMAIFIAQRDRILAGLIMWITLSVASTLPIGTPPTSCGLATARRPDGFVEVTPELLVAGQDRVFAVGAQ